MLNMRLTAQTAIITAERRYTFFAESTIFGFFAFRFFAVRELAEDFVRLEGVFAELFFLTCIMSYSSTPQKLPQQEPVNLFT